MFLSPHLITPHSYQHRILLCIKKSSSKMMKFAQDSYSPSHPALFSVDFNSKSRTRLVSQKVILTKPGLSWHHANRVDSASKQARLSATLRIRPKAQMHIPLFNVDLEIVMKSGMTLHMVSQTLNTSSISHLNYLFSRPLL